MLLYFTTIKQTNEQEFPKDALTSAGPSLVSSRWTAGSSYLYLWSLSLSLTICPFPHLRYPLKLLLAEVGSNKLGNQTESRRFMILSPDAPLLTPARDHAFQRKISDS